MKNLVFFDTETTGKEEDDRLIQICYKTTQPDFMATSLFKAPIPIKFEAMATHHITQNIIDKQYPFLDSDFYDQIEELAKTAIFVAHNAEFDVRMLNNEGIKIKNYIDTLRVARHLLPDETMFKLQYLRYKFNLQPKSNVTAHDAEGDVLVLELLFKFLAEKIGGTQEEVLKKMDEYTHSPVLLSQMAFGKYRGKTFQEIVKIDKGYLKWLAGQSDLDEDLKFTLIYYNSSTTI